VLHQIRSFSQLQPLCPTATAAIGCDGPKNIFFWEEQPELLIQPGGKTRRTGELEERGGPGKLENEFEIVLRAR